MANPYLPLFTGDYKRDTDHLTTEEHGAYLLILMALWDQGGRIKSDARYLSRVARVSFRRWGNFWPELKAFFYEENGQIGHRRIDRELAKVREISEKRASAASKKQNKKPKQNNKTQETNAMQMDSTQPKGLGSTPKGVENPTLHEPSENPVSGASDIAPSPETGGALSADASSVLKRIRTNVTLSRKASNADMDEIKRAVQGFDGKCFDLGPINVSPLAWRAICEEADSLGYRFSGGPRIVGGQAA